MALETPPVLKTMLVGDDAKLLATLAWALARPRTYLPILEAPRMQRPDADAEVVRRNNAAARLQPKTIILACNESAARDALREKFPGKMTHIVENLEGLDRIGIPRKRSKGEQFHWGRDRIGLGLLQEPHLFGSIHGQTKFYFD